MIQTKIVATVGPASWEAPALARLARCGVDVFRINFSHGTEAEHQRSLARIRAVERKLGAPLAVIADLCGPKIRVGPIAGGAVTLARGSELAIQRSPVEGTARRISTTLAELVDDIRPGQRIWLDDGKLELRVVRVRRGKDALCRVVAGGMLSGGKGVNLPDTDLSLSALTEKDRRDVDWIARHDFDYVALSFVRSAGDVKLLRRLLKARGCDAQIISKIEKPQALRNIDEIIAASNAVLVARGDMGVEMRLPEVPIAQKRIVRLCGQAGKPCIVATQMLETMTENPTPTRAEVSDVANAVLDGADAVMLSGETAVGKYPDRAVAMMNAIVRRAEEYAQADLQDRTLCLQSSEAEAAIARAVHTIVRHQPVRAVAAFTATGATARMLSKMRLGVPILALTPSHRVMRQVGLFYGVQGCLAKTPVHTRDVLTVAARRIRQLRWARKGEKVVVVSGRPLGVPGKTNTLVVHTV